MCHRDYFEPVDDPARNEARGIWVCPTKREKARKAIENEVEVIRLKRENERLLAILERASNTWTVKDQTPR